MIHSLLSGLPDIFDEDDPPQEEVREQASEAPQTLHAQSSSAELGPEFIDGSAAARIDEHGGPVDGAANNEESRGLSADIFEAEETVVSDEETLPPTEEETLVDSTVASEDDSQSASPKLPYDVVIHELRVEAVHVQNLPLIELSSITHPLSIGEPSTEQEPSETIVPSTSSESPSLSTAAHDSARRASTSSSSSSNDLPVKPRVSLVSLLERADELYTLYPPTHPSLDLRSIMGPQSVVFTWSENFSELPSDNDAELMVTQPHLIVLPAPEEFNSKEKDSGEDEDEGGRRGAGKVAKRRRRKLRKSARIGSLFVERRAVVASAVLVLGVAMAVYGMQAAPERHHGAGRELRKLTRYVGGLVLGMGGKLGSWVLTRGETRV